MSVVSVVSGWGGGGGRALGCLGPIGPLNKKRWRALSIMDWIDCPGTEIAEEMGVDRGKEKAGRRGE